LQLTPALIRGARILQLFNQKEPSYFLDAIVALYAVLQGYMDDVRLQYSKFYEYLLVNDVASSYRKTGHLLFNMTQKNVNYLVRYWGLNSPVFEKEVREYLDIHTHLFKSEFQTRMMQLKSDADLVKLKNLLYACKRAC